MLLVVDGGSQDGTVDTIQGYSDPRLLLIHQPGNSGRLPGAINLGLARATGDYLTWTSDDNVYQPDAISTMATYLDDHPAVDWVYTDYWRVDEEGQVLAKVVAKPVEEWLLRGINGPCFLFRRRVYEALGEQDTQFPLAADYEYWLRAWRRPFRMQPLNVPVYRYRLHPYSLTSREGFERFLRDTDRAMARWIGPDLYRYPSRYARMVAENYVAAAFEMSRRGDFSRVRSYLLRAFRFDPRRLGHRGVFALLVRSIWSIRKIRVDTDKTLWTGFD
ncbi:MAG: glycosyltransferase [Phycisphaerae bacterium]